MKHRTSEIACDLTAFAFKAIKRGESVTAHGPYLLEIVALHALRLTGHSGSHEELGQAVIKHGIREVRLRLKQ